MSKTYILPIRASDYPELELSVEISQTTIFGDWNENPGDPTDLIVKFYGRNRSSETIDIDYTDCYVRYEDFEEFSSEFTDNELITINPGERIVLTVVRINNIPQTVLYETKYTGDKVETLNFWLSLGENYINSSIEIETEQGLSRALEFITAPNLYDTDTSAIITYKRGSLSDDENLTFTYDIALSIDGKTPIEDYRVINHSQAQGTYTIMLTNKERRVLSENITLGKCDFYYLLRTWVEGKNTIDGDYYTVDKIKKVFYPTEEFNIFPTVKDISEAALALTGDENTFIKYISTAEYNVGAIPSEGGTITEYIVRCGDKHKTGTSVGIIENVESGIFKFQAVDSRLGPSQVVSLERQLIEYVKPTCSQSISIELAGEAGAKVNLTISGIYFNGSFGAVDNTLKLEVRHTQLDGTMGEWTELTDGLIPKFDGNTYELDITISGFDYSQPYTFQCRATDKLRYAESAQYTVKLAPIFDWSEEDFNFNVPINMNGETVLRHNKTAKNTVLSASGGHIYLRPGGTDNTDGEIMIQPDGTTTINGDLNIEGVTSFPGQNIYIGDKSILNWLYTRFGDYVVETGTEAMGSNGTWYWTKWASGKAECYGRRNFGRLAMTTSVTNGYRSEELSQDLPSDLFVDTPDIITISPQCLGENSLFNNCFIAPSGTLEAYSDTTGGFYVIRMTSGTSAASPISFNIIGRWK